ncbi:hypothetical protein EBZ80_23475 [bacterium]|nr:hypothetical protein [bacterium]
MGLTILEAAKTETDPQRVAVIRELAESELISIMPFRNVQGGLDYAVEAELPAVGFRGYNETYDESYGVINPQYERLKFFGGDIDVDIQRIKNYGPQAKAEQIQMKVRSLRLTFEEQVINGDESVDVRAFDGLKTRINVGSSQAVNVNGALSLTALDELIDAVDGDNKILLMNKKMRRRLSAASRNTTIGGFMSYEQDAFGRRVTMYNDARIVVTDTNAQNVQIQGFTETSSSTSIYCVAFGDLQTTGIQGPAANGYGIDIREFGEIAEAPVDRTRIDWSIGMAIMNGRSAARAYGITDAAVTA